jgi:hypothetical protein
LDSLVLEFLTVLFCHRRHLDLECFYCRTLGSACPEFSLPTEYIRNHRNKQEAFIQDLKELFEKHKDMLDEEQYFAVWNQSPLSQIVAETTEPWSKRENYSLNIYGALLRIKGLL